MQNTYVLILLSLLVACTKEKNTDITLSTRPVKVVKVGTLSTIDRTYTGTVEAEEFSILAFKVAGTLTSLPVEEGQIIPKNYVIARIDPIDYRLKYQTAESNYETAKSIYERTERLLQQNATAVQNLEIARADYIRATSALNIAKRTFGYTQLLAPFRGLVEKKYVENFQQVQVGEAIVRLVNPDKLNVRFILPETAISVMQIPKTIYVQFDTYPGRWFQADIKEYIYSSDGSGIPVTLRITDPDFKPFQKEVYPGFSAKVLLKIENTISDNFIIPASALLFENNRYYIWLVNPEQMTVQRHPVKVLFFEDKALIKKGLYPNDIIVTAGVADLKDGQKVMIQHPNNNL